MPHIKDQAFLLTTQDFEERKQIIRVFTREHGICQAIANRSNIKPGDLIQFTWKSRRIDGLGFAKCELIQSYAIYFLFSYFKLKAVHSILQLINAVLANHSADLALFEKLMAFMNCLVEQDTLDPRLYIRFELFLLSRAGYGLSLECCAITNSKKDLYYLSPKSGRAVSKTIGLPYHHKLFVLPQCFIHNVIPSSAEEYELCYKILDYFWTKCHALSDITKIHARQDVWRLMSKPKLPKM